MFFKPTVTFAFSLSALLAAGCSGDTGSDEPSKSLAQAGTGPLGAPAAAGADANTGDSTAGAGAAETSDSSSDATAQGGSTTVSAATGGAVTGGAAPAGGTSSGGAEGGSTGAVDDGGSAAGNATGGNSAAGADSSGSSAGSENPEVSGGTTAGGTANSGEAGQGSAGDSDSGQGGAAELAGDPGEGSAGESNTGDDTGGAGAANTSDPGGPGSGLTIVGNELMLGGEPFHIRGVNWNPIAKGNNHPEDLDYAGFADQDIALMKAAGINVVRTYERLGDVEALDKLYAAGIYVFSTVYGWWQDDPSVVTDRVNAVKDHPAILAWVIGNEWNYNHLYGDGNLSLEQTRDQLNEAAALIKAADSDHPVSTIYGGLGGIDDMIRDMPDIDIWGLNVYQGLSNSNVLSEWGSKSDKPMYLGEYGADAWDSNADQENACAQAWATFLLTQELISGYADAGGTTSGGFVFEWADEWWKAGEPNTQESGGIAPGGGPHPDQTFNEEYWGLVDIDRNPRFGYYALAELYAGGDAGWQNDCASDKP